MGGLVSDSATRDVIAQINARFEADAIAEMAALQKEFQIFSDKHSLYDSWLLLGIKAAEATERARWKKWTEETLRGYTSNSDGMNGHDCLVKAFKDNLESQTPLPMYYKHHLLKDEPRVLISRGRGPFYSMAEHVVMSIPITPVGSSKRA